MIDKVCNKCKCRYAIFAVETLGTSYYYGLICFVCLDELISQTKKELENAYERSQEPQRDQRVRSDVRCEAGEAPSEEAGNNQQRHGNEEARKVDFAKFAAYLNREQEFAAGYK